MIGFCGAVKEQDFPAISLVIDDLRIRPAGVLAEPDEQVAVEGVDQAKLGGRLLTGDK